MAGRTLTIDIKTADAQTLAALKRIQKELKDTGQVAERTGRQGIGLGDALGGLAIGAGIGASIAEFEEAETTLRKTEAVIRSTGNAAGISAEQQAKMVDELSELAAVDDEVVAGGANILRTFTQIKGDAFEPALAAALDLSAALGTDLQSASIQVGKALNDPAKGVVALTRAGVSFTAAQREQIKAMQESGDIAGAQKLILAELEVQFGGQAEAAATDSAKMKVAFGNAAESLGGALAPALSVVADGAEKASAAFQALPQPLQQGAVALGAVAFIAPKVARGYESIRDATTGAEGATTRMGKALGAAGIVAAAGAGVLALNEYRKSTSGLKVDIEALLGATDEAIAKNLMQVAQFAEQGDFEKVGRSNIDALYAMRDALKANGEEALPELTAAIKVVEAEQARAAARAKEYGDAQGAVAPATDAATDAIDDQAAALERSKAALAGADEDLSDFIQGQKDAADAGRAINEAVVGVAEAQDRVADAQEGVADALDGVADANEAVQQARRGVADAERGVQEALDGVEEARRGVTEAEEDAVDAREDVVEATEALAQAERDAQIDSEYMADALQGVVDAEERLALSQADSQAAQEALTSARENYGNVLSNLTDDAAGAADDVILAEIAIRDAQKRLAELNADPEATADDRKRAEIAIREAERRLREAQERAEEAKADLDRNTQNGVEGSDEVVAAHGAVETALDKEEQAQRDLETAVLDVAATQEEANGRVEQAQRDLAGAIDARRDADQKVIDARGAVITANGEVQRAAEGVRDANRDVAKKLDEVRDAQQRVTDAKEAVKTARGEVAAAERIVESAVRDQYRAYQNLSELFAPGSAARTRMEWLTGQLREQYTYLGGEAPDYGLWVDVPGRSSDAPKAGPAGAPVMPTSSGPAGKSVTINAYGIDDPAATAEWIYARADWELGLLGVA